MADVKITQTAAIRAEVGAGPTLPELEKFIAAARSLGVPDTQKLEVQIHQGYSDPREHYAGGVTLTARNR